MAWTTEDLDSINSAIASGELEIEYTDKKVRYRSMEDLFKAKQVIEEELNAGTSTSSAPRQRRFLTSKGTQ